jgi:hypothetical protein
VWLLGGFEWRYGWEVTARWRNIGRFSLRVDAKVPGDLGEGYGFCNFADRLKPLGKQMGIWGGGGGKCTLRCGRAQPNTL